MRVNYKSAIKSEKRLLPCLSELHDLIVSDIVVFRSVKYRLLVLMAKTITEELYTNSRLAIYADKASFREALYYFANILPIDLEPMRYWEDVYHICYKTIRKNEKDLIRYECLLPKRPQPT